jgi:hypothetical protein
MSNKAQLRFVFVQLGRKPEKYVRKSISNCRRIYPAIPITLIGNSLQTRQAAVSLKISYSHFEINPTLENILGERELSKDFRNGFWVYTLQRLFAITDFHLNNPFQKILHIESDVSLSSNFPIAELILEDQIHWLPFNHERDVASLVYLPSQSETQWLQERFIESLASKRDLTDMTLLREISKNYPDRIMYFPVAESPDSQLLNKDASEEFSRRASIQFGKFQGIFDAAPIGMWLTGQDPRNHRGQILRYKPIPESYIDPTVLVGRLELKEKNLVYNESIPIYDLHIHSKASDLFSPKAEKVLSQFIRGSLDGEMKSEFSPSAYFSLIRGFVSRRIKKFLRLFKVN